MSLHRQHGQGAPDEADDIELAKLVEAFEDARREDPSLAVAEWAGRHPRFEKDLLELLPGVVFMESVAAHATEAAALEETIQSVPDAIGEYRIVRRIGRGGMGVVYLAVQESLDREVALKVLPTTLDFDSGFLERFRREARVAGRLSHPHIVPVYGVGFAEGRHYFAMRHIDGSSLEEIVRRMRIVSGGGRVREPSGAPSSSARGGGRDAPEVDGHFGPEADEVVHAVRALRHDSGELRTSLTVRGAVRITLQVADALAYAHSEGVLHRDIKPGNILVDERGDAWVTDFGLCRIEGAGNLTSEGAILGTLRYMAPEQIEGASDERSDVYSLGLVLFELLTLRPAFDSTRRAKIVHDVLHTSPPKLGKLRSGVPGSLERIVQRATAKLGDERYATAAELARDLQAFLENRPITARRPSALYLARLFVTRHRVAATVALVALVLLAGLTTLYVSDLQASRLESERRAYVGDLVAAEAALRAGSIQRAKHHLARAPERFRAWEWAHLQARVDQSLAVTRITDRALQGVVVDPTGARAAAFGFQGLTVVTLPGLEVEAKLGGSAGVAADWSEDGERIVVARDDGAVQLLRRRGAAPGGVPRTNRNGPDGKGAGPSYETFASIRSGWSLGQGITALAVGEDIVLLGTAGGTVHLWDVERWALIPLATLPGEIVALDLAFDENRTLHWWAFSATGSLLLGSGGGPRDPRGADVRGEQRRFDFELGGDTVTGAALDPGGEQGVLVTRGGAMFQFSTGSIPLRRIFGSERQLEAVAIDEGTVFAVGRDQLVHVVDRAARGRHRSLSGSPHALRGLAVVPGDSAMILTAGEDGVLRSWDRDVAGGGIALLGHVDDVNSGAVSSTGRLLMTGGRDGQVIVWDLERAEPLARFTEPRGTVIGVAFIGSEPPALFGVTAEGELHRWAPDWLSLDSSTGLSPDPGSGEVNGAVAHRRAQLGDVRVRCAEFDAASGQILLATSVGIERLDAELERRGERWLDGEDVRFLAVDETLDQIVAVTDSGRLFGLDRVTGRARWERDTGHPASDMGLSVLAGRSSSGRALGTFGTQAHEIAVFDRVNGREVLLLSSRAEDNEVGERLMAATFSRAGDRILSTTRNGLLSVWDSASGEHLVDLRGHDFYAMRTFTAAGSGTVVSLAADESIQVWGTNSTLELAQAREGALPLRPMAALLAVRREMEPGAILASIWQTLERSDDRLDPEFEILLHSLYVRDSGDPLVAGVYGLARARISPSAETRALLAFGSERLPDEDPRQPVLRASIADYDRARLLADTTLIRGSVEGARLRPNPTVLRAIAGMTPFLPWGVVADLVRLATPVLHGVRAARALLDRRPVSIASPPR